MYLTPTHTRVLRWLAGPFILLALGFGVVYGHLPLGVLVLGAVVLPGMYSVDLPPSPYARVYVLRVGLVLFSAVVAGIVLWAERSIFPTWLIIAAIIYLLLGLPGLVFDLALVTRGDMRRQLYEQRKRRGWPTTTRI